MEILTYEGKPVAVVRDGRAYPTLAVEHGDPAVSRFVFAMAAYALNPDRLASGEPFDQGEARFMARWLLMPNAAFAPLAHLPDPRLAELFDVPIAEIARKRDDLTLIAGHPDGLEH